MESAVSPCQYSVDPVHRLYGGGRDWNAVSGDGAAAALFLLRQRDGGGEQPACAGTGELESGQLSAQYDAGIRHGVLPGHQERGSGAERHGAGAARRFEAAVRQGPGCTGVSGGV